MGVSTRAMAATLYYFPASGRAELSRLIAAAGGIELKDCYEKPEDTTAFGSPGSMPLLEHGELKMAQSGAIENYLSLVAFPKLTPQQHGIDSQFCCIKEDFVQGTAPCFFAEDKSKIPEVCTGVIVKWFSVIEGALPAEGFMHGGETPTAADLVVLNLAKASHIYAAAIKHAGVDMCVTYPKMVRIAEAATQSPGVKEYLEKDGCTFHADPMSLVPN